MQKVDSCEVCGVIAHESCTRKVPDDCRPVAEVGEDMVHQWRPAGAVLQDKEVRQIIPLGCRGLACAEWHALPPNCTHLRSRSNHLRSEYKHL